MPVANMRRGRVEQSFAARVRVKENLVQRVGGHAAQRNTVTGAVPGALGDIVLRSRLLGLDTRDAPPAGARGFGLRAFVFVLPLAIYRAVLLARIAHALAFTCRATAPLPALVIEQVTHTEASPLDAAAKLIGAGCHETRFVTMLQVRGPAVTWWQLEVRRSERAALLADPVAAARRALSLARGGWEAYACGLRDCYEAATSLRRAEMTARLGLR